MAKKKHSKSKKELETLEGGLTKDEKKFDDLDEKDKKKGKKNKKSKKGDSKTKAEKTKEKKSTSSDDKDSDKSKSKPKPKTKKGKKVRSKIETNKENKREYNGAKQEEPDSLKFTYHVLTLVEVFLIFAVVLLVAFSAYHRYFSDKIISGVSIANRYYGGKTVERTVAELNNDLFLDKEITLTIVNENKDRQNTYDIVYEDFDFRFLPVETAKDAFYIGRNSNFFIGLKEKYNAFVGGINIDPEFYVNETKIDLWLEEVESDIYVEKKEPQFIIEDGVLSVKDGQHGKVLDKQKLRKEVIKAILGEDENEIIANVIVLENELDTEDLVTVQPKVQEILNTEYKIKYDNSEWALEDLDKIELLGVKSDDDKLSLKIRKDKLFEFVSLIADEVNRNPRGQVLEVQDGKAVEFVGALDGLKVDVEKTSDQVENDLLNLNNESELVVEVTKAPEVDNEFGIEELIGVGSSKFVGSGANRNHNIETAASRINGVIVAPDENFSFVEAVGDINRSTGYRSSLIISGGRLVLGDGGGVCQVSTTLFRAALNTGLPIVKRSAHSFRVTFYEQDSKPGLDATIYSPNIDLVFKNNTPGHILITSEYDGKNLGLTFKIYGKSDGREVEITEPIVSNRTAPPSPLYVEDPSLPEGRTIQVESPVWGARASFDRVVRYPDGTEDKDTFISNFRPWRAVYKVGV